MSATTGLGSYLGMAEQSAYDTPEAAVKYVVVNQLGLKRTLQREPRGHLQYNGATAFASREYVDLRDDAGGNLQLPLRYDDGGVGMLLAQATGAVADASAGGGLYTHDFTLRTPKASAQLPGLTLYQGHGEEDAEVFQGCIFPGFELSSSAGAKELLLSLPGVIARASGGLTSQGTPSYAGSAEFIDFDHFGAIAWNGRSIDSFLSFALKVTIPMERRLYMGSLLTARPVQTGLITIEFTATVHHGEASDTANLDSDWRAGTAADLTLGATGTAGNALGLTVHNAYLADISHPVGGTGLVTSTLKWIGQADASDMGVRVRLTNALATYKT